MNSKLLLIQIIDKHTEQNVIKRLKIPLSPSFTLLEMLG